MIGAVLFGGYYFLWAPSSQTAVESPEKKGEVLNKFVTEVAAKLKKKDISKTDKYIIARATDEWARNPFLENELALKPMPGQQSAEAVSQEVSFTYSGYMETGNQRLAIINGMEYTVGEELEPGGYIVNSISATQVVIGVVGTAKTIIVEVKETN